MHLFPPFSHPKQPSVSLLKRNSLCNLKDATDVFTFGLFCSVLNAKGVSHKQANGSIFLKSVLKLGVFTFTVVVVCMKKSFVLAHRSVNLAVWSFSQTTEASCYLDSFFFFNDS